jgi:hypothetical protein
MAHTSFLPALAAFASLDHTQGVTVRVAWRLVQISVPICVAIPFATFGLVFNGAWMGDDPAIALFLFRAVVVAAGVALAMILTTCLSLVLAAQMISRSRSRALRWTSARLILFWWALVWSWAGAGYIALTHQRANWRSPFPSVVVTAAQATDHRAEVAMLRRAARVVSGSESGVRR